MAIETINTDFIEHDNNTPLTTFYEMGLTTLGALRKRLTENDNTFYIIYNNGKDEDVEKDEDGNEIPVPLKDRKLRKLVFNGTISEYTTIYDLLENANVSSDYVNRAYETQFACFLKQTKGLRIVHGGMYLRDIKRNQIFVDFNDGDY